jgi:hypothetical protein
MALAVQQNGAAGFPAAGRPGQGTAGQLLGPCAGYGRPPAAGAEASDRRLGQSRAGAGLAGTPPRRPCDPSCSSTRKLESDQFSLLGDFRGCLATAAHDGSGRPSVNRAITRRLLARAYLDHLCRVSARAYAARRAQRGCRGWGQLGPGGAGRAAACLLAAIWVARWRSRGRGVRRGGAPASGPGYSSWLSGPAPAR